MLDIVLHPTCYSAIAGSIGPDMYSTPTPHAILIGYAISIGIVFLFTPNVMQCPQRCLQTNLINVYMTRYRITGYYNYSEDDAVVIIIMMIIIIIYYGNKWSCLIM